VNKLEDLIDTFLCFQNRYGWETEETAENLSDVLASLNWEILEYDESSGIIIKNFLKSKEIEYLVKLLKGD